MNGSKGSSTRKRSPQDTADANSELKNIISISVNMYQETGAKLCLPVGVSDSSDW